MYFNRSFYLFKQLFPQHFQLISDTFNHLSNVNELYLIWQICPHFICSKKDASVFQPSLSEQIAEREMMSEVEVEVVSGSAQL